jgi:hypothetical protein
MADDNPQHQIQHARSDDDDPSVPPPGFTTIAIPLSRHHAAMLASTQPPEPTATVIRPVNPQEIPPSEQENVLKRFTLLLVDDNEVNLRVSDLAAEDTVQRR